MRSPFCVPSACGAERSVLPPTPLDSLLLEGEPVLAALGVMEIVLPQREVSFLWMSALLKRPTKAPTDGQKRLFRKSGFTVSSFGGKAFLVRGRSNVTGGEGGFQITPEPWTHLRPGWTASLSSLAQRDSFLLSEVGLVF